MIDAPQLFTSGEQFNDKQFAVDRDGTLVKADPAHFLDEHVADPDFDRVTKHLSGLLFGAADDENMVSLDEIETLLLRRAVDRAHGNVAAAARLLGITRPQMVYRLKSRGIHHHSE